MSKIKSEILKEVVKRIKQNLIPSFIAAMTVVLLLIGSCTYIIKSKLDIESFDEAFGILITSLVPMLFIVFSGLIIFIVCLLLEE
ncbi:hypothetical protein KND94_001949 [Staphylococcus pseudintermedius]|nr:hypothetical protein [Staphylococcus pseudintermedius]HEC2174138.1 hypothetical protein [Staphylococcus delphini]